MRVVQIYSLIAQLAGCQKCDSAAIQHKFILHPAGGFKCDLINLDHQDICQRNCLSQSSSVQALLIHQRLNARFEPLFWRTLNAIRIIISGGGK